MSNVRLARQVARDSERARRAQLRAAAIHAAAVARRERVLRRSRRALPTGLVVAGAALALMVPLDGDGVLAAVAGAGAVRAAVAASWLRNPPQVPPAPPERQVGPPPPPHPRSAAFPAVRRLDHAHGALASLLPLIGPPGREVAEEAWRAASDADAALRWQATRLAAAEPYRGADPVGLAALEQGVSEQERLVQAVADLVAASADPFGGDRVRDVADRLHGLAAGLRDLR